MLDALWRDERAIEGLPIRLVIALIVGVASLGVMMSMINGLGTLGVTELDVQPEPEIVAPGDHTVAVTVVGAESETVSNATVVAKGGTAQLGNVSMAKTNDDGVATLDLAPSLGPNQVEGTVTFTVNPPDGSYADRRENTALLVVDA